MIHALSGLSIQNQMGANQRRLFYDRKPHYALDFGKHKIHVRVFFSLQTAFLCPPLLDDFFLVSCLIYTSNRERTERQFFYDHGMVLAPIFGAFLCDSTQHAACWFSLVFQPPGLLAEAGSWLRQTNESCSENREMLKAWSRKFWCLLSSMDYLAEGMCNQEDFWVLIFWIPSKLSQFHVILNSVLKSHFCFWNIGYQKFSSQITKPTIFFHKS